MYAFTLLLAHLHIRKVLYILGSCLPLHEFDKAVDAQKQQKNKQHIRIATCNRQAQTKLI